MKIKSFLFVLTLITIAVLIIIFAKTPLQKYLRDFISPFAFSAASKPKTTICASELFQENILIAALRKENAELRNLLKIEATKDYLIEIAEITIRDPANWKKRIIINKGKDRGISEGMIALAANSSPDSSNIKTEYSAIGRVVSVSGHSAEIATIFDNECLISVMIGEEGIPAILKGDNEPMLIYFDADALRLGIIKVFTSPYSAYTPPYISVGAVHIDNKANPFCSPSKLYLEPAADIERINFVIILVPQK
jgi:cell shape-determining protein MreC